MEQTKKALIYCRVSSKKQEHEGSGLTSQEKRCQDFAKLNGYVVERVFHDTFSGGGDFMMRPAMSQLLKYVDGNIHNEYVVIFDDLKRFARDTVFHIKLREEFKYRNLGLKCLNFNFEDSAEGEFIETIIAAHGQLERLQNKRQVIQKMKARLERGIYSIGGYAHYGYKFEKSEIYGGKILTINEAEKPIVKKALEDFACGVLFHMNDIVSFFNEYGLKRGKVGIRKDTVKSMLRNILYAGYIEFPKWNVMRTKGVHEPIISLDTYEKIQERLDGKIPNRTRKDMREDFPLRGLVLCSFCKFALTASWSTGRSKKYPFYRCKGRDCHFKNKSIPKDLIENLFLKLLADIKPSKQTLFNAKYIILSEAHKRERSNNNTIEKFNKLLRETKTLKSSFVERLGTATEREIIEIYEERVKYYHNKLKRLENAIENPKIHSVSILEPAINDAEKLIEQPIKYWVNKNFTDQRLLLQTLFLGKLEFDQYVGFGTTEKIDYIRFFEKNTAFLDQDFHYVNSLPKSWNQGHQIADSAILDTLENHWEDLVNSIYNLAHLHRTFTNKEKEYGSTG